MNKLKNILKNMEKLSKSPARRAIGVPRGDTHAHAAPWLAGRPLGGHTCHASKSLPNPAWRGRRRHFCRTLLMGLLLCCSFITGTMYGIESQDAKGDLTAISDGEGSVVLLWFPPVGEWPRGGWRLTNEKGKILKKKIKQGDKKLQTSLSRKDSKALADIVKGLETANTPEEKKQRYGMLGLMMASDIELARGMGLCYTVGKVKKGEQRYRVIGLDARGKKTALVLTSNPVDAWQATPLPPIPTDLEASALPGGTALYWSPVPENTFPSVAAYSISRVDEQGKKESLTDSPLILGTKWEKSRPVFTDGAAPVEQSSIYLVSSVDLFQRRSIPARLEFFRPSVLALRAPSALKGTAGKGKIILSWRHHGNPFTRGIVIERSIMQKGPFEVLTPDGISPDQTSYEDPGVRGGTVYYYRMRSAGPRGDVGEPSALVSVTAINKTPPPAVTGLKVNVGRTRVRLSWQAMEFPVAGFQVERQMPNGKWFRLNRKLSQENVYNDYYGRGNGSVFRYRVKAIAFDQQEGAY
ncbi:MAG: hypothetical protein GY757_16040, partial [bacterium]|nr:hypothetical protein [bacterium]